jgi:hypothetical protein
MCGYEDMKMLKIKRRCGIQRLLQYKVHYVELQTSNVLTILKETFSIQQVYFPLG